MIGLINEGVIVTLRQKEILTARLKNTVDGYRQVRKKSSKPLLAVVGDDGYGSDRYGDWFGKLISETRTSLIAAGIPIYPTVDRAASAARKVCDYHTRRSV